MKNSVLILFVMIGLTAMTWAGVYKNEKKATEKYNTLIENAEKYEEKEIYIDAIEMYKQAYEMDSQNYGILIKLIDLYENLSNDRQMEETFEQAVALNPKKDEAYLKMFDYYISKDNIDEALKILNSAVNVSNRKNIDDCYSSLEGKYEEKYVTLNEIGDVYNNTLTYKDESDKCGLISSSGARIIGCSYDEIGAKSKDEQVIAVCSEGLWYYVDGGGNKKLVPDAEYDFLGTFSQGYAPAKKDGVYGYVDKNFEECCFEYDYAGGFENGIAPVKKDNKWAVINTDFKNVTEFVFDDIIVDEYGFCSEYGVFFAKSDGRYRLYSVDGKAASDIEFDAAQLFASEAPAAVLINGKWGFVSCEGEVVIEPQYQQATSFSSGYAAVMQDGMFGYIDLENRFIIEPLFAEARPFYDGCAYVKKSQEASWTLIKLYVYDK